MIAIWMFASMALAAALGGAAFALERAMRFLQREGRAPWMAAMVAAVAWPALASLLAPAETQSVSMRALGAATNASVMLPNVSPDATTSWLVRLGTLDQPLLVVWFVASALLLVRLGWALAALHRAALRAPLAVIDDTAVRVTPDVGPAVFALWRAHLLLPQWLMDLDVPLRRMVMAHEREHVRARDPQLIVATFVLVAFMPWNAPLWWLARRLRIASELDCDARVLRTGTDAHTYGHLLLLIAQRQANARFLPMMAGAPSTLHARIIAMSAPRPKRPALQAALLSFLALAFVAFGASPALARPLASARRALTTVFEPLPQGVQPAKVPAATPGRVPAKTPAKGAQEPIAAKAGSDTAAKPAKAFKEFKLDEQAKMAPGSKHPRYPEILKSAGITGSTLVMFVVDTAGRVEERTLKVVRTAHQLFVDAVKASLPGLTFYPARVGSRPVKQLVQVLYRFVTTSRPAYDSVQTVKDVNAFEVVITGVDETKPTGALELIRSEPAFYIVDGKRASKEDVSKIPTEKIASVEVFKGEIARAKYGDEGKNGVVVITTKPKP